MNEKSGIWRASMVSVLAIVAATGIALRPASAEKEGAARMGLEHLFDVQLQYTGPVECGSCCRAGQGAAG